MKIKKLLSLLLALAMVFAVAACGGDAEPADSSPTPSPSVESNEPSDSAEPSTPAASGLKIVIVTSGSSVDDGSFNQDNYEGILDFIAVYPDATVNTVQSNDINDSLNDVNAVIADYDVLVLPGFQFAAVSTLAVENPDKYFILVDSAPDAVGEQTVFDNIYSMVFKEQESGFFAGIAAALETVTGKVAVVNGIAYPSNVNYQFGFEAGVAYANKHLDASAEIVELPAYAGTAVAGAYAGENIGGNYVNDFGDEAGGKVVGDALIAEGCDIIFVAAGLSGNGVFTAAKENEGVKVIGCDVDQYGDGEFAGGNVILTCALKNMRINVTRALTDIADGEFVGDNYLLGAETDSVGYVSKDGRNQLSSETIETLDSIYAKVKDGTIVPPGNFTEGTIEEFPGL